MVFTMILISASCSDDNVIDTNESPDSENVKACIGRYEGKWIVNRQSADKAYVVLDSVFTMSQLPQSEILKLVAENTERKMEMKNSGYKSYYLKPVFVGYSESSCYFNFVPDTLSFQATCNGKQCDVMLYVDTQVSAMVCNLSLENISTAIKINKVEVRETNDADVLITKNDNVDITIKYSGNKQ